MSDEWTEGDEQEIGARCLTLCRRVEFDATHPDSPYSLCGILSVFHVRTGFPVVWREPVWWYVEFHGLPADHKVWFDIVRLVYDEEESQIVDEVEEASYGPFVLTLLPEVFIHSRSYYLPKIPFNAPGLHEFRLRVAAVPDVLCSQRLFVMG